MSMPDGRLRILGVGDAKSRHFARWARRLAEKGHEVHVASGRVNPRGEVVERRNVEAVTAAILRLARDPELRRRYGERNLCEVLALRRPDGSARAGLRRGARPVRIPALACVVADYDLAYE
jgi:hypothetical protein